MNLCAKIISVLKRLWGVAWGCGRFVWNKIFAAMKWLLKPVLNMQIIKELRSNSKPEHWKEGSIWLAWSLVGGLFPVWLSILVFPLAKQEVTISAFTDNGEFALYSAAYVAGTLYILFRDFKSTTNPSFPSKSILGLIFSALLIASAAMFLVVCLFNVIHSTGNDEIPKMLDKQVLRTLSLWVFPISMALSFLVVVTDNVKSSPDVQKVVDGQFNDLNNAFEQLGNPKP